MEAVSKRRLVWASHPIPGVASLKTVRLFQIPILTADMLTLSGGNNQTNKKKNIYLGT